MNTYFSNIHKGTITLGESPEWNLGNIILKFYEDPNETYVDCLVKKKIFGKERLCSLTHLHLDNSEMESFIKEDTDQKYWLHLRVWRQLRNSRQRRHWQKRLLLRVIRKGQHRLNVGAVFVLVPI